MKLRLYPHIHVCTLILVHVLAHSGDYSEYFGLSTNVDACVYLMLANEIIHKSQVRLWY